MKTAILTAVAIATSTILPNIAAAQPAGGIKPKQAIETACGGASWYSLRSRTASGEMMNPAAMTAAHKTLPMGSKVRVTNLKNNRSIVVTINDRGPFIAGRVIDLSKGAAQELDFISAGVARVLIQPAEGAAEKPCA